MKNQSLNSEDRVPIIIFLQGLDAPFDSCDVHQSFMLWLFKQYLNGTVESIARTRVPLPMASTEAQERSIKSYPAIFNYLIIQFATDDNIASVAAYLRRSKKHPLQPTMCHYYGLSRSDTDLCVLKRVSNTSLSKSSTCRLVEHYFSGERNYRQYW